MPDPLSIGIVGGYAALQLLARPGSALSPEARALRVTAATEMEFARRSCTLFGAKTATLSRLWSLRDECGDANWDGDGAQPISEQAAAMAEEFIRALPDDLPLPELSPEPDGSISLDWIRSRHRLLSLSIGPSNRLAYAWLDGSERGCAVAGFDGERIPPRIIAGIKGVMDRGDAAVGPS